MEVGASGSYGLKPVLGSCGSDHIRKRVVAVEGDSDGTCALNLGSCGRNGSPKHIVEMGRGDGIEQVGDGSNVRGCRNEHGRLRVDCGDSYMFSTQRLKTVPWRRAAVQSSAKVDGPVAVELLQPARCPWRWAQSKLPRLPTTY